MPTPMPRSDGSLRALLIAEAERSARRWGIPGVPNEHLEALRAGELVGLSSGQIMTALFRAGQPCDDYCYGGQYFRSSFVLDERDQLRVEGPIMGEPPS